MSKLAIIPARGGSKRIPRKNIKNFLGNPIISYSIKEAMSSNLFDEVMVSTDDREIADVAKKFGASVPFLRSSNNSDDYATTADVIQEVLQQYSSISKNFEHVCCIYPTAPLLASSKIKEAYTLIIKGNYDSVFPVVKYSYPIQRSLIFDDGNIQMSDDKYLQYRSQDLEDRFHDAGQFYWLNVSRFLDHNNLFTKNSSAIVLDEIAVQDIDNLSDWIIAELKYKLINS